MQNDTFSTEVMMSHLSMVLLIQIPFVIFLYVNCLMIFTFLKKEAFRTDTRYILFAHTLFVDSSLMVLTDFALVGSYFQFPMPYIPCCVFYIMMSTMSVATPWTLAAMCLERYVAICMPLRHADISTPRNRRQGFVIIWAIALLPPIFTVVSFLSLVPPTFLLTSVVCSVEMLLVQAWLYYAHNAFHISYFFFMFIIVVFTYISIHKAAQAASSDNKSANKGLKTVILHGFQLLLCLAQFICPFVEMAILEIDFLLFISVRYSNFLVFYIAPRCLSPLIYGLRDEKFYVVLRHYAFFGLDTIVLSHLRSENIKFRGHGRTGPLQS